MSHYSQKAMLTGILGLGDVKLKMRFIYSAPKGMHLYWNKDVNESSTLDCGRLAVTKLQLIHFKSRVRIKYLP